MVTRVVSVNDVLDGHVGLDLECFDRICLNRWVPTLQVPGQVAGFLTRHLGFPIPSPAILERIGLRFRKAVTDFAAEHEIPLVRFAKGERKREVMRPYLERLARQGRTGVAAIGVAQQFQRVFTGTTYHADEGGGDVPRFGYAKAARTSNYAAASATNTRRHKPTRPDRFSCARVRKRWRVGPKTPFAAQSPGH